MSIPAAPNVPKLDILFVVDNSGSTLDKQHALEASFPTLVAELTAPDGGLPDLHIGFVTTTVALGEHDGWTTIARSRRSTTACFTTGRPASVFRRMAAT